MSYLKRIFRTPLRRRLEKKIAELMKENLKLADEQKQINPLKDKTYFRLGRQIDENKIVLKHLYEITDGSL